MELRLVDEVIDLRELCSRVEGAEEDVTLIINSPGGSVMEGLQMVNAIKNSKHKVTARVRVMAASIAAVIALACDSLEIDKNSIFMLHDCWTVTAGNRKQLQQDIECMEAIDTIMHNIVEEHCKDKHLIQKMDEGNVYMTGEEAVELFDHAVLSEPADRQNMAAAGFMADMIRENRKLKEELEAYRKVKEYTVSKELKELLAQAAEV